MKKYRVSVCWTIDRIVEVEAENEDEAREAVYEDLDHPIAIYGGRGDDRMDVSDPYVPDDDWACEEVEE